MSVEFAVFDHIDRGGRDLSRLYDDRLELAAAYDRLGFYSYHVAEHHATPLGLAPSPGIFLSSVAQRTKRIRLGPLVYLLPLYDPLRLIWEICMLDHLSGGRLQLGVGRGISLLELTYHGVNLAMHSRALYQETLDVVLSRAAREACSPTRVGTCSTTTCRWSSSRCRSRTRRCGAA